MGKKKKNKKKFVENIELYKEFYFFEINRKHELNNAINLPILVLTLIFSINFYLLNQELSEKIVCVVKLLTFISFLSITFSIYFLISSFSNFAKSHSYLELANMSEVLSFDEAHKDSVFEFQKFLKEEFAKCSSHNFTINKNRTEDLANSKKGIFISLISTFIFSIVYLVSILN
ncbi:hypothetical protein [uncultured Flavobacterium sp.]|uniref:hypothetical protein n=1 Tax=uncultured Flavobacterium sp. TaxID=165435 RepID=UPI0030EB5790|tara:strand:+ start:1507 stop:2028 length:522 start_codon:yes stop_codon:yes gene_type:complete